MRVLLIRSSHLYPRSFHSGLVKFAPTTELPLGLLYVAAMLEKEGHETTVFDALTSPDNMQEPLSEHDGQLIFGAPNSKLKQAIQRCRPDVVGITNNFSSQVSGLYETARVARSVRPDCTIVAGGANVTADTENIFASSPEIDYIIRGEGEYKFPMLLKELERNGKYTGIDPAIIGRDCSPSRLKQNFEFIKDMDAIPLPAYHHLDLEKYFHFDRIGFPSRVKLSYPGSERSVSVITSRGCPYGCTFCSVHIHMGKTARSHSIPYVMEHLQLLKSRHGVRHVHFEDDIINMPSKRLNWLAQGMIDNDLRMTWDTPNGLRAEGLNRETLALARKSGCIYLVMGVESGDQQVVKTIVKKNLDLKKVVAAAESAQAERIDMGAFFIVGFPNETLENMDTTARFAIRLNRKLGVATHALMLSPIIGTEVYESCSEAFRPERTEQTVTLNAIFKEPVISGKYFTTAQVKHLHSALERRIMLGAVWDSIKLFVTHPVITARVFAYELGLALRGERRWSHLPRNLYLQHFLYRNALVRQFQRGGFFPDAPAAPAQAAASAPRFSQPSLQAT